MQLEANPGLIGPSAEKQMNEVSLLLGANYTAFVNFRTKGHNKGIVVFPALFF